MTGARVRRARDERRGPRDRRDLDRPRRRRALRAGQGRGPRGQRDRHAAAAAPVGVAGASRTGSRTRPGLVGRRLMMHPVRQRRRPVRRGPRELAGPVRLTSSSRSSSTRPTRSAASSAAPSGASRRPFGPINAALPSRAGDAGLGPRPPPPRQVPPRPRRELGPVRRGPARRGEPHHALADAHRLVRASRRPRSTTRCPRTRGGCSTSTSSGRRSRCIEAGAHTVEVDRLMRYSGWHLLGHRPDGRRPGDVGARPLEPDPRRPEPVRRRRQLLRHLAGREPDLVDRARSRCAPRTTWSRRASSSRCRHERRPRRRPTRSRPRRRRRATFAAVADHLIPAAHGMPSAGDVVDDDAARGSCSAPGPTSSSRSAAALRPELGDDPAARLAALERDEPDRARGARCS